jgi:hypothetical protein
MTSLNDNPNLDVKARHSLSTLERDAACLIYSETQPVYFRARHGLSDLHRDAAYLT